MIVAGLQARPLYSWVMPEFRAVFDAAITFSNEGGLQAQRFRVDIPNQKVSQEEIARLFVASLDLLMTDSAVVSNLQIIEEPHKGTRGGPSDPRTSTLDSRSQPPLSTL
jgi:hypothetical protein